MSKNVSIVLMDKTKEKVAVMKDIITPDHSTDYVGECKKVIVENFLDIEFKMISNIQMKFIVKPVEIIGAIV